MFSPPSQTEPMQLQHRYREDQNGRIYALASQCFRRDTLCNDRTLPPHTSTGQCTAQLATCRHRLRSDYNRLWLSHPWCWHTHSTVYTVSAPKEKQNVRQSTESPPDILSSTPKIILIITDILASPCSQMLHPPLGGGLLPKFLYGVWGTENFYHPLF